MDGKSHMGLESGKLGDCLDFSVSCSFKGSSGISSRSLYRFSFVQQMAVFTHRAHWTCSHWKSHRDSWRAATVWHSLKYRVTNANPHSETFISLSNLIKTLSFSEVLFVVLWCITHHIRTITFAVFDRVDVPVCCVFALAGFCQQTGWVHLLAERRSRNHRQLDATQSWYRQPQTLPGNSPCE